MTNQQGIGKGVMSREDLENIHCKMSNEFINNSINITDIFHCPHKITDNCECRKPKSGMLIEAIEKYDLNINKSYLVGGDSESDIVAGKRLNIQSILVSSTNIQVNENYHVNDLSSLSSLLSNIL